MLRPRLGFSYTPQLHQLQAQGRCALGACNERWRMLLQPSRFLLSIAALSLLYVAPATMLGQAPQKNYKDDKEFPLYNSILQDTNPKTRMEKIHEWEQKYPQTEFIQERRDPLLTTHTPPCPRKETGGKARQKYAAAPENLQ